MITIKITIKIKIMIMIEIMTKITIKIMITMHNQTCLTPLKTDKTLMLTLPAGSIRMS